MRAAAISCDTITRLRRLNLPVRPFTPIPNPQARTVSTLERLTRMLAADSGALSSACERLDALQSVTGGFLQQWHQASCTASVALCCQLNLPRHSLPPFPSQLVECAWA